MNLAAFVAEVEAQGLDLHGFSVVHRGQTSSHWWAPYRPSARHALFSLSKTFTALGVLFAVQERGLSLDDPVVGFFPRQAPPASPLWTRVTVRHLLTMTLGFDADPTPEVTDQKDWVGALFARPLDHAPGTRFVYNSMATYLASAVVQTAVGMSLRDWLVPRLFEPLGIVDPPWDTCPLRRTCGGWGLWLTVEEVARLGVFLLHEGEWDGHQLLDRGLVAEAVRAQVATGRDPLNDSHQGYGFQLWRCRHGAFRADGAFGQLCVVRPDLDLVVAVQAGVPSSQPVLDLIWKHLDPGTDLEASGFPVDLPPLVHHPPTLGEPESAAIERFEAWRNRAWVLEGHPRGWARLGFGASRSVPTFWYQDDRGVHEAPFGWGCWVESRNRLWRHVSQRRRLYTNVVSGRWPGPTTLELTLRFPEEAPVVTLTLVREGDSLVLSQSLSVTMAASNFQGVKGSPC